MSPITKPNIRPLATGVNLVAKQMAAPAGALLPKHLADQESIVFVHEGECIIHINNADVCLKPGEAYAVPADVVHQIKVIRDFRGIHIMPKEIQFTYFD